MSERVEREQLFHDHRYASGLRERADKFYTVARMAHASYDATVDDICTGGGRTVLEYGCGTGSAAFRLAGMGNEVEGIDISPVALAQASAAASEAGLSSRLTFRQMDAESLEYADNSFDLVCGSGILHHLDLAQASDEIARVLKVFGTAVFIEPLGHNPAINLYRRHSPEMRTTDEHPLRVRDFDIFRARFGVVEVEYFVLLSLLAVPFRSRRNFDRLVHRLERVDATLFRHAGIARQAWLCKITLAEPGFSSAGPQAGSKRWRTSRL